MTPRHRGAAAVAPDPEGGATAAEYALLVALVAALLPASVAAFGTSVSGLLSLPW